MNHYLPPPWLTQAEAIRRSGVGRAWFRKYVLPNLTPHRHPARKYPVYAERQVWAETQRQLERAR